MARNNETPLTFNLPDGDSVQLITWEFVLKQLEELTRGTFDKMAASNGHLENIAKKLEEWASDEGEGD